MELAFLLGRPLYEMTDRMTYEEYVMWGLFFAERPPGWRDDDRTYKLLRALGVKASPESIFGSLAGMKQAEAAKQARRAKVPKSGSFMHAMLLKAKGGDRLDLLKEL